MPWGGSDERVDPEVHTTVLRNGDTLLLCTDGLTGHLSNDAIRDRLRSRKPLAAICGQLIEDACRAGASDDITVVVARVPAVEQTGEVDTPEDQVTTRVAAGR